MRHHDDNQGPALRGLDASGGLYLHPTGLLRGAVARMAVAAGQALPMGTDRAASLLVVKQRRRPDRFLPLALLSRLLADEPGPGATDPVAMVMGRLAAPPTVWAGFRLDRPLIMGIVNVTADSFSDGGAYLDAEQAIAHGRRLRAAGADILDVGGESTRPGALPVDPVVERDRVVPVVAALAAEGAVISVDTRRPGVMRAALAAGARIINDVTALADPDARRLVAQGRVPTILMHMQGEPGTMQDAPVYDDVVLDVYDDLGRSVDRAVADGLDRSLMMVDPGIGFGKTLDHNLAILRHLALYRGLGCGVLLGLSRKRMIGTLTGVARARDRVAGSLAGAILGLMAGADVVRVHDVAETVEAIAVLRALDMDKITA